MDKGQDNVEPRIDIPTAPEFFLLSYC